MELTLENLNLAIFDQFYNENKNLIITSKEINVNEIVQQLVTFCFSDKFIPFLYCQVKAFENNNKDNAFILFISLYESREEYLSIKILFNLMEELKEKDFDNKLKEIFTRFKNEPEELKKMSEAFLGKENFQKSLNAFGDDLKELLEFFEKHSENIEGLWNIHSIIFFLTFKDIINECTENNQKEYFISETFSPEDLAQIDIQSLLNYMFQLKPLNNTKNVYHFILFLLNDILIVKQTFYANHPYISDFFKELESSMKNGSNNLNIKDLQEIIPFFALELFFSEGKSFESLIIKYECKEKYLSLKIFFYLLEILKREKFDSEIKEVMCPTFELLKKRSQGN